MTLTRISRLFTIIIALCVTWLPAPAAAPGWTTKVTLSSRGGHIIGNPNAKVKVAEYASYTCSHCARFEVQDVPLFKAQYIANGSTSLEIRNLVRDPVDITMAMLARCGGTAKFIGNHRLLMATQSTWMPRERQLSEATLAFLKPEYADAADQNKAITAFMQGAFTDMKLAALIKPRGITVATARKCLADQNALAKVVAMTREAASIGFTGTPGFMINGVREPDVGDLASLKTRLSQITQ